ncbi:MAG: hypothetical protein FD180_3402 [Planctomycetota bacterium]|nr:MAG: hypothetical protein FD180_3402 [Planctomycetota bacterium]
MKRTLRNFIGFAGLLLVSACEESAGSAGHVAKSGWLGDLEEAKKEAKASNRPILIDFGAEW